MAPPRLALLVAAILPVCNVDLLGLERALTPRAPGGVGESVCALEGPNGLAEKKKKKKKVLWLPPYLFTRPRGPCQAINSPNWVLAKALGVWWGNWRGHQACV